MKIFIICFLFPLFATGQKTYTGTIYSYHGEAKIPFATVGLVQENTGTNTDENGSFTLLSLQPKRDDTLLISSVGYESLKIPLNKLPENMEFKLLEKQATLKEVFVHTNKAWSFATLSKFDNCGTFYLSGLNDLTQAAQLIHSDTSNCLLTEIEICKYSIAIIDPARSIFRIRIYGVDPISGGPANDLTDSIIEVNTDGRRIKVNLEKYRIYIPDKDFFVAVEWLKIPYNSSKEHYKINGKRVYYTMYSPLLCHKNFLQSDPKKSTWPYSVWTKNYKGQWKPMTAVERLMISAKIKY